VAEIEWKGAIWKAAYGELSVKDLLTILKGYGPMEILEFEKSATCRGQIGLCISDEGSKEITIYDLEVQRERRKGQGRETLQWLKNVIKGDIHVEYPELPAEQESSQGSLPFWVKMFREGLIDGLECGRFCLYPEMGEAELKKCEDEIRKVLGPDYATSGSDESQR
jgi:hypothetical protein